MTGSGDPGHSRAATAFATPAAAAAVLAEGGVVAYPTEAVFGLGCDPRRRDAVERLLAIKRRPAEQAVLLIGADFAQVEPYIDLAAVPADALARAQATWPGPVTWIFPRRADVPAWLTGAASGIALRVTAHAPAAELCRAFGAAIVSTSANRHGEPPARSAEEARRMLADEVDAIVDARVGGLERPTPIRDAITGNYVRS